MATTTNYGWDTPDDTDLVKDGALAMRDLGGDIDTTLYTALGGAYPGLRLVKKQTIGTGVTSVTVSDAFSATYNAYKIVVSGGAATGTAQISMRLGASATEYYGTLIYANYTGSGLAAAGNNNATSWSWAGIAGSNSIDCMIDLNNPFLTKPSSMRATYFDATSSGSTVSYHNSNVSYTAFTLFSNSGNWTGGTIYVYGYGAS